MRIGILTYHYVYNEGAIWQACALCRHLRASFPGHAFEIIDYRHASKHQAIRSMGCAAALDMRESVLADCLGGPRIESDDPHELFDVIQRQYDAVIVGSDIVWQFDRPRSLYARLREALEDEWPLRPSRQSAYACARDIKNWIAHVGRRATQPSPRRIPCPNAYWLDPGLPVKRASFAASIGYSDAGRLSASLRDSMRSHLAAFDFLSVRDQPTRAFLEALDPGLGRRAELTPDPAWLFEDPLPEMGGLLRGAGMEPGRPYAGVLFPARGFYGRHLEHWVFPALRERGFTVVSVIDRNPQADIDLAARALTPFEWWSVIRALDFLFTVRTHPSIAALRYGTPLCNVDITAMQNRSRHSKSMDMLDTFGLADVCLFRRETFTRASVVACMGRALNHEWDWTAIGRQVARHRARCREVASLMMAELQ